MDSKSSRLTPQHCTCDSYPRRKAARKFDRNATGNLANDDHSGNLALLSGCRSEVCVNPVSNDGEVAAGFKDRRDQTHTPAKH
jgi:hypothetical protein